MSVLVGETGDTLSRTLQNGLHCSINEMLRNESENCNAKVGVDFGGIYFRVLSSEFQDSRLTTLSGETQSKRLQDDAHHSERALLSQDTGIDTFSNGSQISRQDMLRTRPEFGDAKTNSAGKHKFVAHAT